MNDVIYTMTFADGSKLENLTLNGNNYIAAGTVDDGQFASDKLVSVKIEGSDGSVEELENQLLNSKYEDRGNTWFSLRSPSAEEKKYAELNSKIEYIAIMGGVEL